MSNQWQFAPPEVTAQGPKPVTRSTRAGSPGGRGRRGRRSGGGRGGGMQPAGLHPRVETVRLWVDRALPDQAAKGGLDMGARAPEAVVQLDMAEGGVHVVLRQEPDHPPADPGAFRIARRP